MLDKYKDPKNKNRLVYDNVFHEDFVKSNSDIIKKFNKIRPKYKCNYEYFLGEPVGEKVDFMRAQIGDVLWKVYPMVDKLILADCDRRPDANNWAFDIMNVLLKRMYFIIESFDTLNIVKPAFNVDLTKYRKITDYR